MTVSTGKTFEKIFRESFVLELAWENKIDYEVDDKIRNENFSETFPELKDYFEV